MNPAFPFTASTTALIVVDMQNFTVAMDTRPFSGRRVLENCVRLAAACRKAGGLVILVRVGHSANAVPQVDVPCEAGFAGSFSLTDEMRELPSELGPLPGDLVVDKYNWGAFYGTNLDAHLRRRNINTLLMCGLVTNIGVDTTMREANAHNYSQVLVTDATSAMSLDQHDYVLDHIAPRIALLRTTDQVVAGLSGQA